MTLRKTTLAFVVAAALAPLASQAQYGYPPVAPAPAQVPQRNFTQAELDQMLAPVALYPDALLSQVLMASTYPIEVVEAARWTRANPGLQGDAAVRAVEGQDWDPSVKSLVAFPEVLQRMDENLEWTRSLGDAFLAQQAQLMDEVQALRRRAQAAGSLRSSEQIRVEQRGPVILVEPAAPDMFYVPYYDPLVVYGTWWWPAYRPVRWAPWPGYARLPGASIGFWFGRPAGVSLSFFFGDFDWNRRTVRVVRPSAYYYREPRIFANNLTVNRGAWQHDPTHRRGVRYSAPEVRQRFAGTSEERRDAQRGARQEQMRPQTPRAPQAAATPQFAPAPALRQEQRQDRREERQAARVQAQPQAEARHEQRPQPQARQEQRPQPQARQEQRPQPQARQEHRQEQRASMPAAQAPQQPRAERRERQERREEHREHHEERGQKS